MPQTDWLGDVYLRFRRELFSSAWTVLRQTDLAEDAVQTAFLKLVKLARAPSDPKLYVFRSVRNAAIDLARARSRRREEPIQADWDTACPEPETPDADVLTSIALLLEQLEDPSREVIELHLHASLTFQEIAQVLGEPLPTVASRYRRAVDKLGKEIKVHHE
jgi:RNA polymerase sigma factor (sigma-70 family)